MKRLTLTVMLFAVYAAFCEAPKPVDLDKMTSEQRDEYHRQRREARFRKYGRAIIDKRSLEGKIVFLNAQKRVAEKAFASIPPKLGELLRRDIVLVSSDTLVSHENLAFAIQAQNANAVIVLIDDPAMDSLLIAPETGWAVVNIAKFATNDNVRMENRVRRELLRAFAFLCGADSATEGCVLNAVRKPDDIDELVGEGYDQETMIVLDKHLSAIGVKPYRITNYRRACLEGWAPAPTNDVQKAIWDEVHTIPDQPIKIKYEKK